MNKTQVKGTMDQLVGSAKRKTGELTGNKTLQVKGIVQQAKGKITTTIGQAKDAVCAVIKDTEVHVDAHVKLAAKNSTATASVKTTRIKPNSNPVIRAA
jgi:uncharacterized protein YjbJ (UPF0337 family)